MSSTEGPSTVTGAVECASPPEQVFAYLADPRHLPQWAPGFADAISPGIDGGWQVSKGTATFAVRPIMDEAAGTADYLREGAPGRWIGAFLRVTPQPRSGSVITMTLPIVAGADANGTAGILNQELTTIAEAVDGHN